MQFKRLPLKSPLQPSSAYILKIVGNMPLYDLNPGPWSCNRILALSNGDTTVRETAPAIPPAIKDALDSCFKNCLMSYGMSLRISNSDMVCHVGSRQYVFYSNYVTPAKNPSENRTK